MNSISKKLPLLLGALLLLGNSLFAQVSILDSAYGFAQPVDADPEPNPQTYTTGYSVASGSDRLLVATLGVRFTNSSSQTLTGVSFGGVAMTQASKSTNSGDIRLEVGTWYLTESQFASISGSDLAISYLKDSTSSQNADTGWLLATLGGVDQSTPVGASGSQGTDSGGASVTLSSLANNNQNLILGSAYTQGSVSTISSGTIITPEPTLGSGDFFAFSQVSNAASYTFTNNANNRSGVTAVEFVAVPEPSTFALMAGALGLAIVMLRRRRG